MSFYSFIFLGKFLPSLPSLSQQRTDTMEETTDSSFLSFTDMTGRLTGRCHNYVLASQQTSVSLSRWAAVLTLHQHIIVDALYFSPILLSAEWIQSRLPFLLLKKVMILHHWIQNAWLSKLSHKKGKKKVNFWRFFSYKLLIISTLTPFYILSCGM